MGLLSREEHPAVEYTEELRDEIDLHNRDLCYIMPPRESEGFEAATRFIRDFFIDQNNLLGRGTPTWSFSPTYHDGRIGFYATAPDGRLRDIRDAVTSNYPGAQVREVQVDTEGVLPIPDGHCVSGVRLDTHLDCMFPLLTSASDDGLVDDPQSKLLPRMVGDTDEMAMIQAILTPVSESWFKRGQIGYDGDAVGEALDDGVVVGHLDPRTITTDQMQRASKDVQRQSGRDAFAVSLRVIGAAPTPQEASDRVGDIVGNLNVVKNPDTEQKLVVTQQSGSDLTRLIQSVGGRWPDTHSRVRSCIWGRPNVLIDRELGEFLVHLPNEDDVDVPMDWQEQTESERIPPDAF